MNKKKRGGFANVLSKLAQNPALQQLATKGLNSVKQISENPKIQGMISKGMNSVTKLTSNKPNNRKPNNKLSDNRKPNNKLPNNKLPNNKQLKSSSTNNQLKQNLIGVYNSEINLIERGIKKLDSKSEVILNLIKKKEMNKQNNYRV